MSIDAEGKELEVLLGFSFETHTIEALVVETSSHQTEITMYLAARGYQRIEHAGVDGYYIHKDTAYDAVLNQKSWRIHPPGSGDC